MKFNKNHEYYFYLLFFLILHAKLLKSLNIKSVGLPLNANSKKNNISKIKDISTENHKDIINNEDYYILDMYNKTTIQNSFLGIKNNLDKEFIDKHTPLKSKLDNIIEKNQYKISNLKKNIKIKKKAIQDNKNEETFVSEKASEDELVFKLNELEAKFTENYQFEGENKSNDLLSLVKNKRGSIFNNKNKPNDKEIVDYEEANNYSEELNIEEFLTIKSEKKKYMEEHNVFMFYNSLSLVMLSMLGGGVIGILFILYFSYKDENHKL